MGGGRRPSDDGERHQGRVVRVPKPCTRAMKKGDRGECDPCLCYLFVLYLYTLAVEWLILCLASSHTASYVHGDPFRIVLACPARGLDTKKVCLARGHSGQEGSVGPAQFART